MVVTDASPRDSAKRSIWLNWSSNVCPSADTLAQMANGFVCLSFVSRRSSFGPLQSLPEGRNPAYHLRRSVQLNRDGELML
jgi:hypothetical protein